MNDRMRMEMDRPRQWFRAEAAKDDLTLYIYDIIGPDFWEEGTRTGDLVKAITESKAKAITVHINSPGGLVFDGIAIYNALRGHGARITTVNDAMAASAASIVFAAGDERLMSQGSLAMVHNAWGMAVGDHREVAKYAERLEKATEQMAEIYARHGLDAKEWRKLMDDETDLDSDEAMENGLATGQPEEFKMAACAWSLDMLSGVPDKFVRMQKARQKRDKERDLRDGGLSAAKAKKALSEAQRDADDAREIVEALRRNIEILTR